MRILYISVTGTLGGAERCLLTAMNSLKKSGGISNDIHLISCTDGPLLAKADELGVTTHLVPMPPVMSSAGESGGIFGAIWRVLVMLPALWRYIRALRNTIATIQPDVIHSNGLKVNVLLSLVKPTAPVVWHLHDFVASRRLMARLLRRCSRRAARAIAISQAVANDARPILDPLPIDVVMNAIDTDRFSPIGPIADLHQLAPHARTERSAVPDPSSPSAADPSSSRAVPDSTRPIKVGLVATYAKWKGHDLFLRAAARILHEKTALPVHFYIVGGPIYHTAGSQWSREELLKCTHDLHINDKVTLIDFQPDTPAIYRALDIVVHASTRPEPFGLTIVEAMACGKPIVVSNAGGAAEIITDGTDALAFPPNDESALAQKLLHLINHADLRATLAQAARTKATTHFSDTRYGSELLAVYRQTN